MTNDEEFLEYFGWTWSLYSVFSNLTQEYAKTRKLG